uniref:Ninja-family protein n=1 Tax=Anthurium amnicola TaxID=1678845 RepID=A0A1D1YLV5_9ARAE
MEDENGLELSLGLSCGGSSSKSKAKDVCLNPKSGDGNRNKSMGGNFHVTEASFKPFPPMGIENLDSNGQQHRGDLVKHQHETFWTDLGHQSSVNAEGHRFPELWPSNNKASDAEMEKPSLNKRKLSFDEINLQKKQERGVDHVGVHGKGPTGVTFRNLVSLTTEDGSSGENEDVAESEAEGSSSWLASQHEEKARALGASKANDKHFSTEQDSIGSQSLRQSNVSGNESTVDRGKLSYGIPLSRQSLPVMGAYQPPSKVPTVVTAPNSSTFASPCVMQLMPLGNNEQPTSQQTNSNILQHAFGYSPVQLPTLETNSSWVFGSQPQHLPTHGNRGLGEGAINLEHAENGLNISQAQVPNNSSKVYDGKASELGKGSGKQAEETGTSSPSRAEDESKGITATLKFGGSGSRPELPWVSTTGPGPNGKTISGVTYNYSADQIKIVCACHGSHMTPEEFVQHASGDAAENNAAVASFPNGSAAASAPS